MASVIDDRGYNQGFERTETFNIRINRRAELMMSNMVEINESTSILEIGSGTGEISYYIAKNSKAQVLGSDLCQPFIDASNKEFQLPNLNYITLDFNHPEVLNGKKFDYIIGNGILHHLYHHLDSALLNINLLLKENGKLLFMEPNIYNPYCYLIFTYPKFRKMANLEPDEMAFSRSFISEKLKNAKFKKWEVEYKDFLLPNTPLSLVKPLIKIGNVLEKVYPVNRISQSIFISATK